MMSEGGERAVRNSSYEDALAKCPYYMVQTALDIKCEGLTACGSITVHFRRGKEKRRWVEKMCNSVKGCEACPIWKIKSEREG